MAEIVVGADYGQRAELQWGSNSDSVQGMHQAL
jgi:hypothetical protein